MTELVLHFVLLEHIGHPDDPAGKHFDLLLEQAKACETWRLAEIPVAEGPSVAPPNSQIIDLPGSIKLREKFLAGEDLLGELIVVCMNCVLRGLQVKCERFCSLEQRFLVF